MKTLKFEPHFIQPILSGEKTSTWRMFDDKNLQEGDKLKLLNKDTGEEFAEVVISSIRQKKLGEIDGTDFEGHARYESQNDMLNKYKGYYGDRVTLETPIKIINFILA